MFGRKQNNPTNPNLENPYYNTDQVYQVGDQAASYYSNQYTQTNIQNNGHSQNYSYQASYTDPNYSQYNQAYTNNYNNTNYSAYPNTYSPYQANSADNYVQSPYQKSYTTNTDPKFFAYNNFFQTQTEPNTNPTNSEPKKFKLTEFLLKSWWLVLLVVLGISLMGLGVFAYFSTNQARQKVEIGPFTNVVGTIEGPRSLAKGSPGIWKITIENRENSALNNVEVKLNFDPNFEFIRAINLLPQRPQGDIYLIPRIENPNRGSGQIIIQIEGTTKGNIDEEILMQGEIIYTPENLLQLQAQGLLPLNESTRRQVPIQAFRTKTNATTIQVEVIPTESTVQNGGEAEITVLLKNTAENEIKDLRIRINYPDKGAFTYYSSELLSSNTQTAKTTPDFSNNIWYIPNFGRLQQKTLKVRGKVEGADGVKLTFSVEIAIKSGNDYQTIIQAARDIRISSQNLMLKAKIEGKEPGSVFRPGENLTFLIEYQNQGTQPLRNVEILAFVEDPADLLDWNQVQFVGGDRGSVNNKVIQWRGTGVSQLVNLGVTQRGFLRFSIKVKDNPNFIKSYLNQNSYILIPKVQAKASNLQQIEISGDLYKARGNLEFEQKVSPLPRNPAKLNERKYVITWTLRTLQNQVNQVVVASRSPLPPSAWNPSSISPVVQANQLTYNPTNGEITWNPKIVPSYTGISNALLSISFELTVESDKDTNFAGTKLLDGATVFGVDDFTNEKYQLKGPDAIAPE